MIFLHHVSPITSFVETRNGNKCTGITLFPQVDFKNYASMSFSLFKRLLNDLIHIGFVAPIYVSYTNSNCNTDQSNLSLNPSPKERDLASQCDFCGATLGNFDCRIGIK